LQTRPAYPLSAHKHATALITEWADAALFTTRKLTIKTEDSDFGRRRTMAHAWIGTAAAQMASAHPASLIVPPAVLPSS